MYCSHCGATLGPNARFCASCGKAVGAAPASVQDLPTFGGSAGELKNSNRQRSLGLIGAAVLFVGVFMPILSVPIVGSVNYFQNGRGDGTIILVLALLALLLTATRSFRLLWIPGVLSLALLAFTFINIQAKLNDARDSMTRELADNPFRGLAEAMAGSVQLQWGWAVLVVGAVILIAATFGDRGRPRPTTPAVVDNPPASPATGIEVE